jgi:hypothetical protein
MTEGINFSPSPFFYIIIGLTLGLIVGWIIGFFDSNSRTAKKIESAEKNAEIKMQEAEKRLRMVEQQSASTPQVSTQDDPGLLRLKHDHSLEMDGLPITGALPPDKKKRLIDLLTLIRPYLEGSAPAKPAAPPQTLSKPVSQPKPVTQSKPVLRPAIPEPVAPIKPTLASAFTSSAKKADEKPVVPLSIVGQIDSVLQSRLMNTPLAGKGISLHEAPDGAVEVIVGLTKYPSIDDVPDETVKDTIRAAIKEWEEKFTPGL